MSKKLYIIRHAKAQKQERGLDDFSRKISSKGKKQCEKVCDYFKKKKIKADLVLCSPAKRAKQTVEQMADAFEKSQVIYDEKIYEANPKALLRLLQYVDDGYETVVLVGHNPSIMTLCAALANTKRSNLKDMKRMLRKFPTGAVACFEGGLKSWQELAIDGLELTKFIRPNKL